MRRSLAELGQLSPLERALIRSARLSDVSAKSVLILVIIVIVGLIYWGFADDFETLRGPIVKWTGGAICGVAFVLFIAIAFIPALRDIVSLSDLSSQIEQIELQRDLARQWPERRRALLAAMADAPDGSWEKGKEPEFRRIIEENDRTYLDYLSMVLDQVTTTTSSLQSPAKSAYTLFDRRTVAASRPLITDGVSQSK
jgi:hypothetical protein